MTRPKQDSNADLGDQVRELETPSGYPGRTRAIDKLALGIDKLVGAVQRSVREARLARVLVLVSTLLVTFLAYYTQSTLREVREQITGWNSRLDAWEKAREDAERRRDVAEDEKLALVAEAQAVHDELAERREAEQHVWRPPPRQPDPKIPTLDAKLDEVRKKATKRGVALPF